METRVPDNWFLKRAYRAGKAEVAKHIDRLNREAQQRLEELPEDGTPEQRREREAIIRTLSMLNRFRHG